MLLSIKQGLVFAQVMCKQQLQLSHIKPLVINQQHVQLYIVTAGEETEKKSYFEASLNLFTLNVELSTK
jgi:hypothetical protein